MSKVAFSTQILYKSVILLRRAKYLDINFLPPLVLLAASSAAYTHDKAAFLALELLSDRIKLGHAHTPELKLSVRT